MVKNRLFTILSLVLIAIGPMKSQNMTDTISYSIGIVLAENLKAQGITKFDAQVIAEAMQAHLEGTAKMTMDDAASIFGKEMQRAKMAEFEENRAAGEAFLAENGKRKEVTTTASGLQYEVVKEGTGPKPKASDSVKVHYHGTLISGQVFDSSVDRGQPISFPLNGVIKGWTEGLQYMSLGSKYILYIPYDLAYGERAAGDKIKPFSALVFEVELLGIE